MNILKAFFTFLLGLLLFVCLTLLNLGIAINVTLLDSKFINSHIDKLDIAGIAEETIFTELRNIPELAAYPDTIASIENTLKAHEADLKGAVKYVISDVYAYVIGDHELNLEQTLEESILNSDFAISILNDLNLKPIIENLIIEMVPADLPLHVELSQYTGELVPVLEPWFKQETARILPDVYDYMLGKSQSLDLSFSLDSVKPGIHDALRSAFLKSPPSEYAALSQNELSRLFDSNWDEISAMMPQSLVLEASEYLSPPGELTTAIAEAEAGLQQARQYVGYYQMVLWVLTGLSVIMILGIFLINRKVAASSMALGIVFAFYGVLTVIGTLIAKDMVHTQLGLQTGIPAVIMPWLLQLADSLFSPLVIFSIACIVTAALWFVLAFVFRRRATSS
jgi:hypothetical protein